MEDLLNIANGVMDNFDPEKDSVRDFTNLPDGKYKAVIEEVGHRTSEKGTQSVFFKCGITDGASAGRYLWASYYFTEKMAEQNIQKMMKIANQLGFDYKEIDFNGVDTIAKSLNGLIGEEVTLLAKTGKTDFQNVEIVLA